MDITWYGHSCFRLAERGQSSVITDPYNGDIGYQLPKKLKADIVTVSHDAPGHANTGIWPKTTHIIDGPGEYEIGGVFVIGIPTHKEENGTRFNVAYLYDFDGLTVAHLGDLSYVPDQSEIDALGAVNVALVPVGGGNSLNATLASELISLIEPDIVVPMHYKTDLTKLDLEPLDRFLKVMGISNIQSEDVLRISKSNLPEQTQVVVLNPQQ
jgi:L-ascorbate metabolism protein UlaG (beta-lactamase superfamily)